MLILSYTFLKLEFSTYLSLHSKGFCTVSEELEQGMRVKDRTKNGTSKRAGMGWRIRKGNLPSPPPALLFHLLALVPFFTWQKQKIPVPRSFFAPKPNGEMLATQAILNLKSFPLNF